MKAVFASLLALAFVWNLKAIANEPTASSETAPATEHSDASTTTETKVAKKSSSKKENKGAKKAAKKSTKTTTKTETTSESSGSATAE